jgi:tight adherence protein C
MTSAFVVVLIGLGVVGTWAAVSWSIRHRALARVKRDEVSGAVSKGIDVVNPTGWLVRWLHLAGFRAKSAPTLFVGLSAACLGLGALGAVVVEQFGLVDLMVQGLLYIPGGLGEGLSAIVRLTPWIVLMSIALAPTLVVRAARRHRVRGVEEDLPLLLELLASLAEGGLGFDAALAKVLHAQPGDRSLASELRTFQAELQIGVGRVQALRRLAWRLDIPSVSTFVSALIHAEQVGASLAETLRDQARDLRNIRRERVLFEAQALPVKLVFPLVLCFLPSMFVTTLGPALYQLVQVLNLSTFRGSSLP